MGEIFPSLPAFVLMSVNTTPCKSQLDSGCLLPCPCPTKCYSPKLTSTSSPRQWTASSPFPSAASTPLQVSSRSLNCAFLGSPEPSSSSDLLTTPWKRSWGVWCALGRAEASLHSSSEAIGTTWTTTSTSPPKTMRRNKGVWGNSTTRRTVSPSLLVTPCYPLR